MKNKQKCFVSIVAYIHNNTQIQIENFIDKVVGEADEYFQDMEVILVTDDDSIEDADFIKSKITGINNSILISKLKLAYYQGTEAAMSAGVDLAVGDFVYEFDSILINYERSLIKKVYDKLQEGYDIVFAGDDKVQFLSKVFYKIFNYNKVNVIRHDNFRLVSRRAINRIKKQNGNIKYRKYQYVISGLPYEYVEYKAIGDAAAKKDKTEKAKRWSDGISYMMMYTKVMEKCTLTLSILFLFITMAIGIWTLYSLMYEADVAAGWTSLMLVISFGFFGIFLLMAFLIKYMNIILDINMQKTEYVVESVDKL